MINKIAKTGFLIFFIFFQNYFSQKNMNRINEILELVKRKYAPDKRTAIFNVAAVEKENIIILQGETNSIQAKEELLNRCKEQNLNFTDEIQVLPTKDVAANSYGIINVSVANLKALPSHSSELVSQTILGTPVLVWKKENSWYLIQTPDDYLGWCEIEQFVSLNREDYLKWVQAKKIIITSMYSFSYENPDLNSQTVSDIIAGNILEKIEDYENYVKVKFPDNRIAFIEKKDCEDFEKWLDSRNPTAENIIKTAMKFLGLPYLWGGTSVKAVDCSGFTKTVFFLNGIVIPRDASQQVFAGDEILTSDNLTELLPGDLLFFTNGKQFDKKAVARRELPKITHVGIYIGEKDYIHASFKVKINSFDKNKNNFNESRLKDFVRASRIINSKSKKFITKIKENKYYNGGI